MDDLDRYIAEREERSPAFKKATAEYVLVAEWLSQAAKLHQQAIASTAGQVSMGYDVEADTYRRCAKELLNLLREEG